LDEISKIEIDFLERRLITKIDNKGAHFRDLSAA
jgi:hypothetical protein